MRDVEVLALISTLTAQVAALQKQVHALARVTVRLTDAHTHDGTCKAIVRGPCNCGKAELWRLLQEVGENY